MSICSLQWSTPSSPSLAGAISCPGHCWLWGWFWTAAWHLWVEFPSWLPGGFIMSWSMFLACLKIFQFLLLPLCPTRILSVPHGLFSPCLPIFLYFRQVTYSKISIMGFFHTCLLALFPWHREGCSQYKLEPWQEITKVEMFPVWQLVDLPPVHVSHCCLVLCKSRRETWG